MRALASRVSDIDRLLATKPFAIWAAVCALTFGIHLLTLQTSPTLWQDEAQIVDWGRMMVFEPATTWSIDALPSGLNVPQISWVGPALQELAYRALAPSAAGHRLSALVGQMLAATLVLVWLRRRGTQPLVAHLLAAAFLIDPLLVANAKGGRVDGWAIGAALAACALLARRPESEPRSPRALVAAGALAALAPFVWPTASLVEPLVLTELLAFRRRAPQEAGTKALVRDAALFASGAIPAALLLLGVLWAVHGNPFQHLGEMVGPQFSEGQKPTLAMVLRETGLTLVRSPFLWLAAVVAAVRARDLPLVAATLLAWAPIIATVANQNRIVFVIPYAIALVAAGWPAVTNEPRGSWRAAALGLVVVWAAAASLVARPALALKERQKRDPATVFAIAREAIGTGSHRVLVVPWEFYFPGRALGWQMIRPYGQLSEALFLNRVDYAVLAPTGGSLIAAELAREGFEPIATPTSTTPSRYAGYEIFRRKPGAPASPTAAP